MIVGVNNMVNKLIMCFLLFMIYSFLGWIMEVSITLIKNKKFVNRGFLIGPYCPIYGYGVLGILFLIGENTHDILSVFLKSVLICSILEYITSYLMEKIFNARWWDYSNKRYNINGRVCLETMIPFGILGTFCFYVINPFLVKIIDLINPTVRFILCIFLILIYLVDNMISFHVMNKIKTNIKNRRKDSTEKIREDVIKWIEKNSIFFKHIQKAFPDFKIRKSIDPQK